MYIYPSIQTQPGRPANLFSHFERNLFTDRSPSIYTPYSHSIPNINMIKHVLAHSPVKTTPENSRKGGHGQ